MSQNDQTSSVFHRDEKLKIRHRQHISRELRKATRHASISSWPLEVFFCWWRTKFCDGHAFASGSVGKYGRRHALSPQLSQLPVCSHHKPTRKPWDSALRMLVLWLRTSAAWAGSTIQRIQRKAAEEFQRTMQRCSFSAMCSEASTSMDESAEFAFKSHDADMMQTWCRHDAERCREELWKQTRTGYLDWMSTSHFLHLYWILVVFRPMPPSKFFEFYHAGWFVHGATTWQD